MTAEELLKRYTEGERDFSGVNLSGINLRGVTLTEVNLSGANLHSTDLSGADLRDAYLSEANLNEANLSGTDLSNADLSNAKLKGTDLSETILHNADLTGTILTKHQHFTSLFGGGSDYFKGKSLFVQSKEKQRKPIVKIKYINLDYDQKGHIFVETGVIKPGKKDTFIKRIWECSQCGCIGIQEGFARIIKLQKAYVNVDCPKDSSMIQTLLQPRGNVKLTRPFPDFGFEEGQVYEIVTCPAEYQIKYGSDIWIFSEKRNEPVRLLPREYRMIEDKSINI